MLKKKRNNSKQGLKITNHKGKDFVEIFDYIKIGNHDNDNEPLKVLFLQSGIIFPQISKWLTSILYQVPSTENTKTQISEPVVYLGSGPRKNR